jgi:hypothetical protein
MKSATTPSRCPDYPVAIAAGTVSTSMAVNQLVGDRENIVVESMTKSGSLVLRCLIRVPASDQGLANRPPDCQAHSRPLGVRRTFA